MSFYRIDLFGHHVDLSNFDQAHSEKEGDFDA